MEQLVNEFTVERPVGETWAVLTDLERIAPCMPGAQLTEIEGDIYRGVVKVKLGAISANFRGQASFVERDDASHTATLKAEGRDTGGKGQANAHITARLTPVNDSSTTCRVETDLHITGKVAQFGRGIMADVSKKLIGQFADNLNTMLTGDGAPTGDSGRTGGPAAADDDTHAAPASSRTDEPGEPAETAGTVAAASTPAAPPRAPSSTVRTIDGPEVAPLNMTDLAGSAVLKRLLPVLGGLVVALIAWRKLRR